MSIVKEWRLNAKYDDSDPKAKVLKDDVKKSLGISDATLYKHLPVDRFPRIDGWIMGVKLRTDASVAPSIDIPLVYTSIEQLMKKDVCEESVCGVIAGGGGGAICSTEKTPIANDETIYQLKESARNANEKLAKKYKAIDLGNAPLIKKEVFTEWFKKSIWRKTNAGLDKVACPVCSLELITKDSFSAGHILAAAKGGMMCIENIMPICSDCNVQMGSRHLYWFAWHYYGKVLWSVY
jgi:hypothetical protein